MLNEPTCVRLLNTKFLRAFVIQVGPVWLKYLQKKIDFHAKLRGVCGKGEGQHLTSFHILIATC